MIIIGIFASENVFSIKKNIEDIFCKFSIKIDFYNYNHLFDNNKKLSEYENLDVLFVFIDYYNISYYSFFIFDVLVYMKKPKFSNTITTLKNNINLKNENIIIINTDEKNILPIFYEDESLIISVGTNIKDTFTISGISIYLNKTSIQCCLQRSIKTVHNKILDPFEFSFIFDYEVFDISESLSIVIMLLILNVDIHKMSNSIFYSL